MQRLKTIQNRVCLLPFLVVQHGTHLTRQAVGGFPFVRESLERSVPAAQVVLALRGVSSRNPQKETQRIADEPRTDVVTVFGRNYNGKIQTK